MTTSTSPTTSTTQGMTTSTSPITSTTRQSTTQGMTTSTSPITSTTQGMTTSTSPTTSTTQGLTTRTSPTTSTTRQSTTQGMTTSTSPITSTTHGMLSIINVMKTPYQAVSCKYLSLSLSGMHIAGIIVVDENGKNMIYGKDFTTIVAVPEMIRLPTTSTSTTLSDPVNKMFKQTVNIDYDRSKGPEYNTNLISTMNLTSRDNIFSYESDGFPREVIFDLNPDSNDEVLVSQIIIIISKDTCSNGQLCMYDNVRGRINLFSANYKQIFDSQLQTLRNPQSTQSLPGISNSINSTWSYEITSSNTDNILNFEVKQTSSMQQFKNINQKQTQKSKFFNLTSSITPDYVNPTKITNVELPTTSNGTTTTTPPTTTSGNGGTTTTTTTTTIPLLTRSNTSNAAVQLLPGQVIDLLNGGMNLDTLSANGIMYNPANRGPTTNIIQTDYSGSSNIYSPYIYYNKGVSEKFAARNNTNDTDKKYYFYNGI